MPYAALAAKTENTDLPETVDALDNNASLKPGKNSQLAAKKVMAKKNKFKIPGEIVKIENIDTPQGEIKVPVSVKKTKRSGKEATKKIVKKYDKIRREKKFKKLTDLQEKQRKQKNIETREKINDSVAKKYTFLAAANKVFDFDRYKKEQTKKKKNRLRERTSVSQQDISF